MRHLLLCVGLVCCLGCGNTDKAATNTSTTKPGEPGVNRDNTAVNERDRNSNSKTPIDQNENQADIDRTAEIRRQVMDAKLSVNGQNVKIITSDGHVTLRGPVDSAEEKNRITEIATKIAGVDKVHNELEVNVNR